MLKIKNVHKRFESQQYIIDINKYAYLGALLLIGGCAKGSPVIATIPPSDIIVPEHGQGRLTIRNGCTYLQTAGGRYTIVWPTGYRWSAERGGVEAPSGKVFRHSDTVLTQGGDGSIDFLQSEPIIYSKLKKCGHPYAIVNNMKVVEK